jgi:hypothetical protein
LYTVGEEDGRHDPRVSHIHRAKEDRLHKVLVRRLSNDATRPRAVMIHFSHTIAQLLAVVRPVRLVDVALVAVQRHAVVITDVRVVLLHGRRVRLFLLARRISTGEEVRLRPDDLRDAQPRRQDEQEEDRVEDEQRNARRAPRLDVEALAEVGGGANEVLDAYQVADDPGDEADSAQLEQRHHHRRRLPDALLERRHVVARLLCLRAYDRGRHGGR